ncbi:MAG TPA: hypothetical protein VFT34_10945 [Verrucomicrobiae bacterium]|nr:hypothetical protein [Verrucomicrobiae bacterium]
MKPENTSQEELQRVLALKRHEQPPRQFFKRFSQKVMDRLQNPEPPPEPTLMQRLGLDFDTKPVLICLSGLAICGLLAFGLILSRSMKAPPPGNPTDPLGQRPIHGSAGGLDNPGLMAAPSVSQEQSGGGGEPITVAPEPGQRIPPRPRPAPVTPVNTGK